MNLYHRHHHHCSHRQTSSDSAECSGSRATLTLHTATGRRPDRGKIYRLWELPRALSESCLVIFVTDEEMQTPCHALSATEQEQSHLLSPHPVFFDVFPRSPVILTFLEREQCYFEPHQAGSPQPRHNHLYHSVVIHSGSRSFNNVTSSGSLHQPQEVTMVRKIDHGFPGS